MTPDEIAAVKAKHSPDGWADDGQGWCPSCGMFIVGPGCEGYLLAVEAERLAGKVARVEAWRDRQIPPDNVLRYTGRWIEVCLDDLDAALANQPEQARLIETPAPPYIESDFEVWAYPYGRSADA